MSPGDHDDTLGNTVCVVGTGVLGLLAIKNLTEQGLDVTAFERNSYVGGNWHATDDPEQVSAMSQTTINTSKQTSSFTDFPMPEDYPNYPTAKQLEVYLEDYATHFDLNRHIVFNTAVQSAQRDESDKGWLVATKNLQTGQEEVRRFDRLVLATGILHTKNVPDIKGLDKFAGEAFHSRAFKDPTKYTGKNVLIIGIGSTGADTACFLKAAGASNVYVSHRNSFYVLPRNIKGQAFDHTMNRRTNALIRFLASLSPRFTSVLMGKGMRSMMNKAFPFLASHPSFAPPRVLESPLHRLPFFSEVFPRHLRDGTVETVPGIREVSGPRSVTLTDERELADLDAIIICSGYLYDFSIIQGKGDPTDPSQAPDNFAQLNNTRFHNKQDRFPRLYHGILSEQYPESLAVLGHLLMLKPAFVAHDLGTMAIASLWTGKAALPSREEIETDIDKHYKFVVQALQRGPMPHLGFRLNCREVYSWLNRTAGTGVMEKLGWGWEGWSFWYQDRALYKLLMDGPDLPAAYRLFDTGNGRRVPWSGARAEIEEVNRKVVAARREWEKNEAKKPV